MAKQENTPDSPVALPSADDLAGMDSDTLGTHADAIRAEADDLAGLDVADMTDAQVDRLEALGDHLDALDAEDGRRVQAAEEREARVQAARDRVTRVPEDEAPADEQPADEAPADGEQVEETPAPEALAAGGTRTGRPAPRPAQRRVARPAEPAAQAPLSLIAAADVGGRFAGGQQLSTMTDVAEAFIQRSKGYPTGVARTANVRHQHSVVRMERTFAGDRDGLVQSNKDFADDMALLAAAGDESRLSGGSLTAARSLVAAGGWCAPSETLYDLPQLETLDGMLDLPTIGITRGGINFTPGPNFSDIFASAGFSQTEAQAIAGTTKPCVEVNCPTFGEVRLDAVGYCVKAPLLTNAAYPELVRRWIDGTLVANQHKVMARIITSMRNALGTPLAPSMAGTPVTWATLSIIEWVIEMQRQAYRLSQSQSLEVVIPRWVRAAVRADLANRTGVGLANITNAAIDSHFADRGAAVQWPLNYLEVANPLTSVAYPTTFEVMVYPAGTFVRGNADVISLDTVYDTADLQTNVYTAAFVEDGVLLAKRQHGGARITLPVKASGQTGAHNLDDGALGPQVPNQGAAAA